MTDWFPTLYSAAGGTTADLGPIDGIDQWDALLQQGPSRRDEMLYNSNPMGTQSPTGSAMRYVLYYQAQDINENVVLNAASMFLFKSGQHEANIWRPWRRGHS